MKHSWVALLLLCACASGPHPALEAASAGAPQDAPGAHGEPPSSKPRPKPPSPESITIKEPGGDAADAHEAALFRQLDEPWGQRDDKDGELLLPLPDANHWKRVRYWGVEHFVGFRYGSEHHVLAIGFVQPVPPGTPVTTDTCMQRFEAWGRPQTKPFDVRLGPFSVHHERWRNQRLEVHSVDGEVAVAFSTTRFSAAWAAYPAYTDGCLVFAMAVPWRDHPDLAREVRDRFVAEGFTQVAPQTSELAIRH